MTGNIKDILNSSDAAKSLRMEDHVARSFAKYELNPERSIYYKDTETGKSREVDVFCLKAYTEPKRFDGIGAPVINLSIYCECKTLTSSNILLSEEATPEFHLRGHSDYWLGNSPELQKIITKISEMPQFYGKISLHELYKYLSSRAYPAEGRALSASIKIAPPKVDIVCNAFRETKNGKSDEKNNDGDAFSPLWSAIRSNISAVKSARKRARKLALDAIEPEYAYVHSEKKFIKLMAFFLDAELTRFQFFHPIIILDAKLWKIESDKVKEVNTARVYIRKQHKDDFYVDLVKHDYLDDYISNLSKHFNDQSQRSIEALWDRLEILRWEPGGDESRLQKLMRP